jgi:hypothetical protein
VVSVTRDPSASTIFSSIRWEREGRLVKGDWVEVVIDAGDGARTYEIEATKAGRRVEIANARGVVEVSEVTRSGQSVRIARFMASRVLALVEHPSLEADDGGDAGPVRSARRARQPDNPPLLLPLPDPDDA